MFDSKSRAPQGFQQGKQRSARTFRQTSRGHDALLKSLIGKRIAITSMVFDGPIVGTLIECDKFTLTVERLGIRECIFKHSIVSFHASLGSEV